MSQIYTSIPYIYIFVLQTGLYFALSGILKLYMTQNGTVYKRKLYFLFQTYHSNLKQRS